MPVRTTAINRSSFTRTPSSLRKALSFGVFAAGSSSSKIRPCLFQKSRTSCISRSEKSYCGPIIMIVFVFDKRLEHGDGTLRRWLCHWTLRGSGGNGRFFVAEDVAEGVFLAFGQI